MPQSIMITWIVQEYDGGKWRVCAVIGGIRYPVTPEFHLPEDAMKHFAREMQLGASLKKLIDGV